MGNDRDRGRLAALKESWRSPPLAKKFLFLGVLATLAVMLVCGLLTTTYMTRIVLDRRVDALSMVIQYILKPVAELLDTNAVSDPEIVADLDALSLDASFKAEFPYIDIWLPNGTLFYSNTPGLMSKTIPVPPAVAKTLVGQPSAQLTDSQSDDYLAHHFDKTYIKLTLPLRSITTGKILAAVQLHESETSLKNVLRILTLGSWVTVAIVAAVVMLVLYSVVLEANLTIRRQGRLLTKRLAISHARAARHRELKAAAQVASRDLTGVTDKYLRTIGTDLHDGPAQSIGFAVLRLDQIRRAGKAAERNAVVAEVEQVLSDVLGEIRAIASDLVLPDTEYLMVSQIIDRALSMHTQRTNVSIAFDSRLEPVYVTPEAAKCTFRFLQEGLNNAYLHGLRDGQSVSATIERGVLKVVIANKYIPTEKDESSGHNSIGLYGLRARVNSLDGEFHFERSNGNALLEMAIRYV